MAKKRKPSWQERKPQADGPRLLDGEVPDGRRPGTGGVFENFSPSFALIFLALGILAALLSQFSC